MCVTDVSSTNRAGKEPGTTSAVGFAGLDVDPRHGGANLFSLSKMTLVLENNATNMHHAFVFLHAMQRDGHHAIFIAHWCLAL